MKKILRIFSLPNCIQIKLTSWGITLDHRHFEPFQLFLGHIHLCGLWPMVADLWNSNVLQNYPLNIKDKTIHNVHIFEIYSKVTDNNNLWNIKVFNSKLWWSLKQLMPASAQFHFGIVGRRDTLHCMFSSIAKGN